LRIASPKTRRDRTPFFGRRQEREQILADVGRGVGLITLCGPSGIGKTRLAQQVAADLVDAFDGEGGVWFCSLAGCRSASELAAVVARALDISQLEGDELTHAISHRGPLLLLLDNAEPIAASIGEVLDQWLERCVELQLLVTSVVPTGAQSETLLELRPLEPEDAVALYLDRAHRAWADRSFSGEEAAEIQNLVGHLDRLPLAIELAAARVRLLPPRTMLSMIEKRFDLLRTSPSQPGPSGSEPLPPPRRSSLYGALELTWNHLHPRQQLAMAQAAVFEGDFTAEAAGFILGSDPEAGPGPEPDVRHLLEDLLRKSLLSSNDEEPPRYVLLESVKDYARSELERMGQWEETIRRHAAYYLDHEHGKPPLGRFPEFTDSIPWLQKERANLLAIHERFRLSAPALSARAGIALGPLFQWEGASIAEAKISEAALDAARRSEDPALVLGALEPVYTTHFRFGRFNEAGAALEEIAALARTIRAKDVEAHALSRLAILHLIRGDHEKSRPPLRRATLLSEEVGQPQLEASILLSRGIEAFERSALEEAESYLSRSVSLQAEHGQRGSEVNALHALGVTLSSSGEHQRGRQMIQQAIRVCRQLSRRSLEAGFLSNLARYELDAGALDEAEAACQASLVIERELGNRFREGLTLCSFGIIAIERGEFDLAGERLSRAEELFVSSGVGKRRADPLLFQAVLEAKLGEPEEAHRLKQEALSSLRSGAKALSPLVVDCMESLLEVIVARIPERSTREAGVEIVARARDRLGAIQQAKAPWPNYLPVLVRLLEKELAAWDAGTPPQRLPSTDVVLVIPPNREWFQLGSGERIVLRRRRVLLRIFRALLEARIAAPGVAVDLHALIDQVWPGVEMAPGRGAKRLYMAVLLLRDLGLRTVIRHDDAGYLLDPAVRILEEG